MKALTELLTEEPLERTLETYSASVLYSSSFGAAGNIEQPFRIKWMAGGLGTIHRASGDCLHIGDGLYPAHIDIVSAHQIKLRIEKNPFDRYGNALGSGVKGIGGYF